MNTVTNPIHVANASYEIKNRTVHVENIQKELVKEFRDFMSLSLHPTRKISNNQISKSAHVDIENVRKRLLPSKNCNVSDMDIDEDSPPSSVDEVEGQFQARVLHNNYKEWKWEELGNLELSKDDVQQWSQLSVSNIDFERLLVSKLHNVLHAQKDVVCENVHQDASYNCGNTDSDTSEYSEDNEAKRCNLESMTEILKNLREITEEELMEDEEENLEVEIRDQDKMLDDIPDLSIEEDNDQKNERADPFIRLGIDLDELMKDFDPKNSDVFTLDDTRKTNISERKESNIPIFSFESKIEVPKEKQSLKKKKSKKFKLKSNPHDNEITSFRKNTIIQQQYSSDINSTMDIMIKDLCFDKSSIFQGYTIPEIKKMININRRINAEVSMINDDNDTLEIVMQSDEFQPAFESTPEYNYTSDTPRKRRRLERIWSMLDRVRNGSDCGVPISISKPLVDKYIRERISGQKNVTIRFSSLIKFLQSEIRNLMNKEVFLRRVFVSLMFSVHEFNQHCDSGQLQILKKCGEDVLLLEYNSF